MGLLAYWVLQNDDHDQAMLKRFRSFGPPTIAFFGTDGAERTELQIVGFADAAKLRDHVSRAKATPASDSKLASTTP